MTLKCKICSGILYQSYGKYKRFYQERLKCLSCGRFYLKTDLYDNKNRPKNNK